MRKKNILNILFWIALVVTVLLVLWKIFGSSSSDLSIAITFGLVILFKMWAISYDLNEFKHEVKMSFGNVKSDFKELADKFGTKKK